MAYVITHQKRQGQVTELSQKYHVSRTFLYENAKKYASVDKIGLSSVLSREAKIVACQKSILFYRLFSNCSLNSIQTFLEHDGSVNDSLGYISEFLRDAGQAVGQDLNLSGSGEQTYQVVFASDEIFAGERAILITVEPISLTILRIELAYERTSEGWQEQWQSLKNQHITPSLFVKDEGCALKCAQNILFANTAVQSDTFHAVSHRLGLWVKRLEKAAFTLMLELEEKERLFCTAQTPQTAQKRLDIYLNCYKETIKAMDLYHNFAFIYQNLIQSFKAFDNKGELKDKENVLDDFQAAIDLGKMLNHKPITKELKTIETLKFTLFTFFDTTKKKP
ncbi:MAG: hypothetical protein U5L45_12330 [Saprospiraceae bacterium]|nr:hypothetical protein [Saprospiraceae bacterium]